MFRSILYVFAAIIVVGGLLTYSAYRGDIRAARAQVASGSHLISTACGPIEYADAGTGKPVLAIHGTGGGFDAGIELGRSLIRHRYRIIAPSRFGYLRTPLPADASPMAQADAHACLLDALNIQHAAVIAASAGSPSAMQLCIRHPERCSALVLISPQAWAPQTKESPKQGPPKFLMPLLKATMRSDFLFWATTKMPNPVVLKTFLGTPVEDFKQAGPTQQVQTLNLARKVLPIEPRSAGMWNDAVANGSIPRYDLERITAPALLIAAQDDLYKTHMYARYSAEHIPASRLVSYPTGGHILIGHPEAFEEIARLLSH